MDIERYNRELAEMEAAQPKPEKPSVQMPDSAGEYNPIVCRTCGHVATYLDRGHYCIGAGMRAGSRYSRLTAYVPNIGKVTKNADPAYRKHAGSRPRKGV